MNRKWLKRCLTAYMAAMAAYGGVYGADLTTKDDSTPAKIETNKTTGFATDKDPITAGNTVAINHNVTVTISGNGYALGAITGISKGSLVISGTRTIASISNVPTVTNSGALTMSGAISGVTTLTNSGTLTAGGNVTAATITLSGGTLTSNAVTKATNTLNVSGNSTIAGSGSFSATKTSLGAILIAEMDADLGEITASDNSGLAIADSKTVTASGFTVNAGATVTLSGTSSAELQITNGESNAALTLGEGSKFYAADKNFSNDVAVTTDQLVVNSGTDKASYISGVTASTTTLNGILQAEGNTNLGDLTIDGTSGIISTTEKSDTVNTVNNIILNGKKLEIAGALTLTNEISHTAEETGEIVLYSAKDTEIPETTFTVTAADTEIKTLRSAGDGTNTLAGTGSGTYKITNLEADGGKLVLGAVTNVTNFNVNGATTLTSNSNLTADNTTLNADLTVTDATTFDKITVGKNSAALIGSDVTINALEFASNANKLCLGNSTTPGAYTLNFASLAAQKTLDIYGAVTATGFTNNGDIVMRGGSSFAGFTTNAGNVTVTGAAVLGDLAANNGTITIAGNGSLKANSLTSGSFGDITISLNGRAPGATTAALIAPNAQAADAGKITFSDGANGSTYAVLKNSDTSENGAVSAALKNSLDPLYSYTGGWDATNSLYTVTVSTSKDGKLVQQAVKDSTANKDFAGAIMTMTENNTLPFGVKEAIQNLGKRNPNALGQAVTALNGANDAVASAHLGANAAQQFNAALGQTFSDAHTVRAIAGLGMNRIQLAKADAKTRASAGGVPVVREDGRMYAQSLYTGWIKGYGSWGNQDNTHAATGYSFNGGGVMVGVDRLLAQELSVGVLFGYSHNYAEMHRSLGEVTDDLLRLGLYSSYNWENFFFNTSPTFGIHMLDSKRKIDFMHATAEGQRTGFDFNWYNQVGYTFAFGKGWMLTPEYSIGWTVMHNPDYSETGAGDANLKVKDNNQFSLVQNLGGRVGKLFQINDSLSILPEVWCSWEHEYLDSNDVNMGFVNVSGTNWDSPVENIGKNRVAFGAGVKTLLNNRFEAYGRYDQKVWDNGYQINLTFGVGFKF